MNINPKERETWDAQRCDEMTSLGTFITRTLKRLFQKTSSTSYSYAFKSAKIKP